jgi:O-antigen ligase
MKQFIKISINPFKIAEAFFYLFLFSLFFPTRYVFTTSTTFNTGIFSDFTSISLYLSDILLFITFLWLIYARKELFASIKNWGLGIGTLILWLIIGILWHFNTFSSLNAFYFLKFLEFIVAYGTISSLFRETQVKSRFLKLFAALGTVQAGLAICQFLLQRPLGLFKLGEQQIYAWNQGIAKLIVNGNTYIRSYGTFPHPNLLSAYLIVTILILGYLTIQTKIVGKRIVYALMMATCTFGLALTFSRASFLALGIGLVVYFGFLLAKLPKKQIFVPLGTIFISIILSIVILKPYLLTRVTISDTASLQRVFYAKVGWQMIKANPIFGVGIGESVLHMQQFSLVKLWPWQIQPIHNYFELSAAELGIPGTLILIWIFWSHIKKLIVKIKRHDKTQTLPYFLLLASCFSVILILMQFDHYFYTLQQTQLLLWLILGAIAAETKNPQRGDFPKT